MPCHIFEPSLYPFHFADPHIFHSLILGEAYRHFRQRLKVEATLLISVLIKDNLSAKNHVLFLLLFRWCLISVKCETTIDSRHFLRKLMSAVWLVIYMRIIWFFNVDSHLACTVHLAWGLHTPLSFSLCHLVLLVILTYLLKATGINRRFINSCNLVNVKIW